MPPAQRRESAFFEVCSKCKTIDCCLKSRPPLTPRRIKIIEAYLKKQGIQVKNPFMRTAYAFPKEGEEGYCVFNDKKTKKCLIHEVKPETCVAGPITFDINIKTQKIEWHLKKETICSLAGRLYADKERLRKHEALARKEILRLVRELDTEALKTILKIEEPETFKISENSVEKSVLAKLV
ncbi:MAG TPA: YkgJ family cysteine cluster protein [Candidatus Krumholzibacteriaceae bacterium]|jgi:Fe-S-cluster containining protein|nr:YkgJ family cysteine cluster protein [Candidatus Krumholzibacteriaceae bacterium]